MERHVGTFWEHFLLLRRHIVIGGLFFIVCAIAVFVQYADQLITLLLKPLASETLAFLSPLGPLLFKIRISMYAALAVAFPVWLLLFLDFVAPALSWQQKIIARIFAVLSFDLSAVAFYITYVFLLPITLDFLMGLVVPGTTVFLTAENYLSFFFLQYIVVLTVAQLPLVIILLSYLNILSPYWLARQRRYVYLALLILFAVLTPTTDAVTLLTVAVPAIALTEFGIAIGKLFHTFK